MSGVEARYSRSISELIECMLEPDPKRRLSATQIFDLFQNPQSLRNSKPRIDVPPLDISVANSGLPPGHPGSMRVINNGRDTVNPHHTDRQSREYSIVVTPPPPVNMSNSLSLSTIDPKLSRPPTFNPNAFGQPVPSGR